MSTSDIYILNKRSTRHVAEFRNGWGSAPVAWDFLGAKYLGFAKPIILDRARLQQVWDLHRGALLSAQEKIVLLMTFDGAYIPLSRLQEAGEACDAFGAESDDGIHANNWAEIGRSLIRLSNSKFSRFARGAALSCTSVSDPWVDATANQLSKAWPIFREPHP